MKWIFSLLFPLGLFAASLSVQILGSGGPELGERASASYLIKIDGKARVLIDLGGGSFTRFSQAEARIEDLELILLTHLHIDHTVDLPALMKAGYFSQRDRELTLIGPTGNNHFPGTDEFISLLFGENGAYRYMSDILTDQSDSFSLKVKEVHSEQPIKLPSMIIKAQKVHHGIVPALAYRLEVGGKVIVFSGDTSASSDTLVTLTHNADLFIAHHAIPEKGFNGAKTLHMRPSRIAQIASQAKVKRLVLSHRMNRTLGLEKQHETLIRKSYKGPITWAEDLMEISLNE